MEYGAKKTERNNSNLNTAFPKHIEPYENKNNSSIPE